MKIIVSDFDATFFNKYYKENIEVANKFMADGNIFIIATGRNFKSITDELNKVNFKCNYYICKDGSAIYDANYNLLYRKDMDLDLSKELYDLLKSKDLKVYVDDTINYITDSNVSANAIIAKIDDREKDKVILEEILANYDVYGYLSRNWINIVDSSNSKSNAIKYLIDNNYIDGEVYTIGDAINDKEMINDYKGFVMRENTLGVNENTVDNIKELIDKIN